MSYKDFQEFLRGKEIHSVRLGKILQRCPNYAMSKLKNPKKFTLEEMEMTARYLRIPVTELLEKMYQKN